MHGRLNLVLDQADVDRLDRLARRVAGSRRGPLARDLIRRGLDAAERDPSGLIAEADAVSPPPDHPKENAA